MAENPKGWITQFLVGALWFLIITAILTIGNNLIASDKDSRARDSILENKLNDCVLEQTKVNQEILITLAKLSTDIDYIKKAVK
jgi:hypothetical protein